MSFVTTHTEMMTAASGNLAAIGSAMAAQNATAAGPTTAVVPPAADMVSALTTAQFATQAAMYQVVSQQAAAVNELFVSTLGANAGAYVAAEAANAATAG